MLAKAGKKNSRCTKGVFCLARLVLRGRGAEGLVFFLAGRAESAGAAFFLLFLFVCVFLVCLSLARGKNVVVAKKEGRARWCW